jgi:hypothetical protein
MTDANDDSDGPAPSAAWSMQVGEEAGPDGQIAYHALVYRAGAYVCRIGLSGNYPDRPSAEEALKVRLQEWIADYETRPHSGQTWFGPMTR